MDTKNNFTVTHFIYHCQERFAWVVILTAMAVELILMIPLPIKLLIVLITIPIIIGILIYAIAFLTFRIEVRGNDIYVRKSCGTVRFHQNSSDITKVIRDHSSWIRLEETERTQIFFRDGKSVEVSGGAYHYVSWHELRNFTTPFFNQQPPWYANMPSYSGNYESNYPLSIQVKYSIVFILSMIIYVNLCIYICIDSFPSSKELDFLIEHIRAMPVDSALTANNIKMAFIISGIVWSIIFVIFGITALLITIYSLTFRLTISLGEIHVRQCFGLIHFQAPIQTIQKVEWKMGKHNPTHAKSYKIFFENGKTLKINTVLLMSSTDIIRFMEEQIPSYKVIR
jgi:hypothetical protein